MTILTQSDARKMLVTHYGADAIAFRLTTKCQIGVRPVWQTKTGAITMAWRKLAPGRDSAVAVGRLLPGGDIDWDSVA